jgi:hypothetical protein
MRSPFGPILILFALAATAMLVLVIVQSIGLRSDLDRARAELATLADEVGAQEAGLDDETLVRRLDELEAGIRDWLIATGADGGFETDPGQPAGGSATADDILDRIDDVLARITALDRRVDEICEGVPVC